MLGCSRVQKGYRTDISRTRFMTPFVILILCFSQIASAFAISDEENRLFLVEDFLMTQDYQGMPITITNYLSINENPDEALVAVRLAGFSEVPGEKPMVLALTWTKVPSGWFGSSWSLVLQSDAGLLAATPMVQQGTGNLTGSQYISLRSVAPKLGHEYEIGLAYDPKSGALSISVYDITEGEPIFAGHKTIGSWSGEIYPGAGLDSKGQKDITLQEWSIQTFFVPVGLSWRLALTEVPNVPVQRLDRREDYLIVLDTGIQLPGYFEIMANYGVETIKLAEISGAQSSIHLDLSSARFGLADIEIYYVYAEQRRLVATDKLAIGYMSIDIDQYQFRIDDGYLSLSGLAKFSVDKLEDGTDVDLGVDLYYRAWRYGAPVDVFIGHWDVARMTVTQPGWHGFSAELTVGTDLISEVLPGERSMWVARLWAESKGISPAFTKNELCCAVQPRPAFPQMGPYTVLLGDFHMHSSNSDGILSPEKRVVESFRFGYDVIAITDHGVTCAYDDVSELASNLGLVLLKGIETGIAGAEHYVILGFNNNYTPRDPHQWAQRPYLSKVFYQDQLRHIRESQGFTVWAHPGLVFGEPDYASGADMREPAHWGIEQGLVRGIEVYNDAVGTDFLLSSVIMEWALVHDLTVFANSDMHFTRAPISGVIPPYVATIVFAKERTATAVVEALWEGRTAALFNGSIWGKEGLLRDFVRSFVIVEVHGERIVMQNQGPLTMTATLQDQKGYTKTMKVGAYSPIEVVWPHEVDGLCITWENVCLDGNTKLKIEY